MPPLLNSYSLWFHNSNQFIHLFYRNQCFAVVPGNSAQTNTYGESESTGESQGKGLCKVFWARNLWYQQTGTPGRNIIPNIMLLQRFLFLLMAQTQFQDLLLSVISSSEKKKKSVHSLQPRGVSFSLYDYLSGQQCQKIISRRNGIRTCLEPGQGLMYQWTITGYGCVQIPILSRSNNIDACFVICY